MKIKRFDDLIGNTMMVSLIRKGLRNRSLPQFILLSGVMGVGKSSIAELAALALTCENPNGENACGVCPTCKSNLRALQQGGSGVSARIEKVNMATVTDRKAMAELLTSTFQIIRSEGRYVKIFEEFDKLPESDQAMMLEETSRISPNVYVILTTTHAERVVKEMESRCLTFTFGRLNRGETAVLVDKVNRHLKLRPADYDMIYRKTGAVPRDIVNLVEFLSANNPTADEMDALLGNIGREVFAELFASVGSFPMFMEAVDSLLKSHTPEIVLARLTDWLVNLVFALEGKVYEYFPKKMVESITLRDADLIYRILKLLETTPATESGVKLSMMKVRRMLAPAMTVQEQTSVAELAAEVKGTTLPVAKSGLTRFRG